MKNLKVLILWNYFPYSPMSVCQISRFDTITGQIECRGVARGEHRGHLPPPLQSHVIFIISYCINTSTKIFTVVFRVKNDHRMADYKAICKQTFELCFDRAVSGLESQAFDGFKGHKTKILQIV